MRLSCVPSSLAKGRAPALMLILGLMLAAVPIVAAAANPFSGSSPASNAAPAVTAPAAPPPGAAVLARIVAWQMRIRQRITDLVQAFETEHRVAPLLILMLMALAYGAVHALGPGHGKAVAMAYALSHGWRPGNGLALGSLIALVHGASAVALVMGLRLVLSRSVSGGLDEVTRVTQVVSYGLITLIGLVILAGSLATRGRPPAEQGRASGRPALQRLPGPLVAAVAIGIVPCPGVAMITLFCLSVGQMGLGIFLAAAVSAGMALSITLAVWISLAGKRLTLRLVRRRTAGTAQVERGLRAVSGLLVTVMGGLFMAAAIH